MLNLHISAANSYILEQTQSTMVDGLRSKDLIDTQNNHTISVDHSVLSKKMTC